MPYEPGYPGSGDAPTMPPPPPDPSGSPPPRDVSDAFAWSDPISGDANVTYTGQPGRILDPVRAAALHQARELVEVWPEDRLDAGRVVEVAKVFEAYLAGPESEVP